MTNAIAASDTFLLFWSTSASKSKYVKFERQLAEARRIKDEDYGFHIIRLDSTKVPVGQNFLLFHDWSKAEGDSLPAENVDSLLRALRGQPRKTPPKTLADKPKLLMILAGPSGVGKDVIIHKIRLALEMRNYHVLPLTRYTTRPPRPGETQGDVMVSLSTEEFYKRWQSGEISCLHTSFGNSYGCDSKFRETSPPGAVILQSMRNLVVLEDMKEQAILCGRQVLTVLLTADGRTLRERILQRTASSEEKEKRIAAAMADLEWINDYPDDVDRIFDLIVDNSDRSPLRDSVDQVQSCLLHTLRVSESEGELGR